MSSHPTLKNRADNLGGNCIARKVDDGVPIHVGPDFFTRANIPTTPDIALCNSEAYHSGTGPCNLQAQATIHHPSQY